MIAGPELLQDRTHVLDLLLHHPEVVERDLVLVEREVELGGRHLLDGLMRDATGRATLLFVAGRNEQADFPARVVDAALWVRDNVALLRRFLGDSGILWELPCRCLIICPECEPGLLRRLQTVAGIDLDLMELRSIRIRNQNCWAGVSRLSLGNGARLPVAGTGAEPSPVSPGLQSTWHALLERLARIDREIVLDGDRYSSEVAWRGTLLCRLRLRPASILVEFDATSQHATALPATAQPPVGNGGGEVILVHDQRAASVVVDRVLRRFLGMQSGGRPCASAGRSEVPCVAAPPPPASRLAPRDQVPDRRWSTDLGDQPGAGLARNQGSSALS